MSSDRKFLPDGKCYVNEVPPHQRQDVARLYGPGMRSTEHPHSEIALGVIFMSAMSVPKNRMAQVLGISVGQLETFYSEEMAHGKELQLGILGRRLMEIVAKGKDAVALRAIMEILDRYHGLPPTKKADGVLKIRWER